MPERDSNKLHTKSRVPRLQMAFTDTHAEEWHRHATRHTEHSEFKSYYGSTDKIDFVLAALHPAATYDPSATYAEVASIFAAVTSAELDTHEIGYFYAWLDAQFPGGLHQSLFSSLVECSSNRFMSDAMFQPPCQTQVSGSHILLGFLSLHHQIGIMKSAMTPLVH